MDVSGVVVQGVILAVEMVVLLLGVTFGVSLLQRRLGNDAIRRWMGGSAGTAALKGIALGVVTPFCTYSAIPVLIGMRQAGIRAASYGAFLLVAPVVDPMLVGALVIVVGPAGAAVYTAVALVAAFSLALFVDRINLDVHLKPLPQTEGTRTRTTPTATRVNAHNQAVKVAQSHGQASSLSGTGGSAVAHESGPAGVSSLADCSPVAFDGKDVPESSVSAESSLADCSTVAFGANDVAGSGYVGVSSLADCSTVAFGANDVAGSGYVGVSSLADCSTVAFGGKDALESSVLAESNKACASSPADKNLPWRGLRAELLPAWLNAVALLRRMAILVIIGIAIGLSLTLFVPTGAIASVAGSDSPLAIPIAAAVGIPFYVGTELFIPIGDALHNSGVSVGAIVALTIAGAGANLPEFALLTTLAHRRVVAVFFCYVFTVAVVGGLITELIF